MNAQSPLARAGATVAAAVTAAVVSIALLSAVTVLFLDAGQPYERVVVAERACAAHVYASEREAFVRAQLAPQQYASR